MKSIKDMPYVTVEQVARYRQASLDIEQQRDELLEALKRLKDCYSSSHSPSTREDCWRQANNAIAKVES